MALLFMVPGAAAEESCKPECDQLLCADVAYVCSHDTCVGTDGYGMGADPVEEWKCIIVR